MSWGYVVRLSALVARLGSHVLVNALTFVNTTAARDKPEQEGSGGMR